MEAMEVSSIFDIINITQRNDAELMQYLQSVGLIKKQFKCKIRNCRRICTVRRKEGSYRLNHCFWCFKCRKMYPITIGTFFERIRVPVRTLFYIMWCWACQLPVKNTTELISLQKGSVVNMYAHLRNILSWKLLQEEPFLLGGEGHTVQIDANIMGKRKYNGGRVIKEHWVLGIYDLGLKRGHVTYLKNRNRDKLVEIIQKHVQEGTEIWTNQSQGYSNLNHLGYIHKTVNNSKYFKNPQTGFCSNQVGGYLSRLKKYLRRLGVISSPFLPQYIEQFEWDSLYGHNARDRFKSIVEDIRQKYK
ncbi:uncharacterized protein LOC126881167 [Diabrotica virgifera virgifera]|uniref:Uncharacterized protein LOC114340755 n=1 Tax=Diabrotica virgifera virgifera TaxID=50390 RepID=A0A6P7GU11_DIAVI|nr:uncharacterized protein LOC126881167 [Diabrotica virgifera virgifera]